MIIHRKSVFSVFSRLLTLIAVLLTVISSCSPNNNGGNDDEIYVAVSKEEIQSNIAVSLLTPESEYQTVTNYLEVWGVGKFDRTKFAYLESMFIGVYNYEGGLPETETHAKDTVELYLEKYYDKIDRSNVTAVTDSLLYCYVENLSDPYSVYRPPIEADEYNTDMSGKFGGIGVVIEYNDREQTIRVTTVYPDSPAEKAGIMVGDYIHAVNGVTVEEIGYRNAVYHVRGEIGTTVELTLLRGEEQLTVTATRAEVEEKNVVYTYDEERIRTDSFLQRQHL